MIDGSSIKQQVRPIPTTSTPRCLTRGDDRLICHNGIFKHKRGEPLGLRELRKFRGLTQAQLAKRTGIARTTLSGYECGVYDVHSMTLGNALKLSAALQCHPSELLDERPSDATRPGGTRHE